MSHDNEVSALWREHRVARQAKRAANRAASTEALAARGIAFDARNDGAHLIVRHAGSTIDFWPSTGRWTARAGHARGFGVRSLLAELARLASETHA